MASDGRTPFTIDDFLGFWRSIVDDSYSDPFIIALQSLGPNISIDAGDDIVAGLIADLDQPTLGLEVFTQQMAQYSRVSNAVVRTTESMYILPHSGQLAPPASGSAKAEVTLSFERVSRFDEVVTLPLGFVEVVEVQLDSAPVIGVETETGRKYTLCETVSFLPGERGPKTAKAVAEKIGYGYNNPDVGSLNRLVQIGIGLTNIGGTITLGVDTNELQVTTTPDVVTPQNVGQYIEFFGGSNVGRIARMVGYRRPDTAVPHGGVAVLALTTLVRVSAVVGVPVLGEPFEQAVTGATGAFTAMVGDLLVLEGSDDLWAATFTATGIQSGATFVVDKVEQSSAMTAEAGTAAWRVMGWEADLGITVTNDASPEGGKTAMLDELGRERGIDRSPGEVDDLYRKRVHQLPDTVSPNAIRRVANRILSQVGARMCLRETQLGMPGFYADVDAADYDFDVRPQDRFKVALNYEEFRAFFLVGVPRLQLGDFGFFYDDGAQGYYDAAPANAFYDGFPVTAAIIYRNIWDAVNKARAGGVGFDLIIETTGCF